MLMVNKYRRLAISFIDRYPLTAFMGEEQIDFGTSLVHPGVDINVMLMGFGEVNREIFLSLVASTQFLTSSSGNIITKPVKYIIFDKDPAASRRSLGESYYRLEDELRGANPDEYLPLPDMPAVEEYHNLDINDPGFYDTIKTRATRGSSDANFIIIAFGSDLENLDMAKKLAERRKEWGLKNLTIFVRVCDSAHLADCALDAGCYIIEGGGEAAYSIANDELSEMAKRRNEIYDIEWWIAENPDTPPTEEQIAEIRQSSRDGWYSRKTELQRESSIYSCLSIRSKLNLMGLDYCMASDGDEEPLSYEKYIKIYAGEDVPDIKTHGIFADGKPVVHYGLDFPPSRRRTMAQHEHQRWNSFMISRGFVPATKEEILVGEENKGGIRVKTNGKSHDLRRHGNLTTFDGLIDFRRMIAERDGVPEERCDVIKYDYQLLDDAYALLVPLGYKIIRRKKLR